MRRIRRAGLALLLVALTGAPALGGTSEAADRQTGTIELPAPEAARAQELALVCSRAVGATPERCKRSSVPGPVINDESVLVGLDETGTPSQVLLEQRLLLTKVGDYVIRERGPARAAVGLIADSDPPTTKLGAVLFQGFTPGNRQLGARLTLDAGLEAPRLPLGVSVSYRAASGAAMLGPGGAVPGAGTVRIRLDNRTAQPTVLPTGSDADPAALSGPLDAALRAASAAPGPRLPSTDTVLPKRLTVASPARVDGIAFLPLRVTGSLRLAGTVGSVTGPGTTALPDGASLAGTLSATSVDFAVQVAGPGRLLLDLTAVPALDRRALLPPRGLPSWAAWAAHSPPLAERQAALSLLVTTAATGARASSYSPYLGADLPGTGSTAFRYAFAPAAHRTVPHAALRPRGGPLALAGLAVVLLLVDGALIWRRS